MIHDVIIVGAGAAGLFAGINLDKKLNKLILEKNDKPGIKVLLSGGERANVSNIDIEPTRDYFTQNKKFLISIFSKYNQWDIMGFFAEKGINIVEEDRGRLILESGDSKELLNCLLEEARKNGCNIKTNQDVKHIKHHKLGEENIYEVKTDSGEIYKSKKVIISSGGKSFSQVGTTGEGYNIAENLGLKLVTPYRTLCGMSTKRDLSEVSGVSTKVAMKLIDNNQPSLLSPLLMVEGKKNKIIYSETGPILFTHFGVSGPIIHNLSNAVGEYLNSIGLEEKDFENYILNNLSLDIGFDLEITPKRLVKFFELHPEKLNINLELQNWRSWKEAKATGGGIDLSELDNHMQSKKHDGLYFVGEVVDVTGKTGGFNLQWAWSSAYAVSKNIKN